MQFLEHVYVHVYVVVYKVRSPKIGEGRATREPDELANLISSCHG